MICGCPFRKACEFGLEGLEVEAPVSAVSGGPVEALVKVKNRTQPAMSRVLDDLR